MTSSYTTNETENRRKRTKRNKKTEQTTEEEYQKGKWDATQRQNREEEEDTVGKRNVSL
jgi:hypothetical protein